MKKGGQEVIAELALCRLTVVYGMYSLLRKPIAILNFISKYYDPLRISRSSFSLIATEASLPATSSDLEFMSKNITLPSVLYDTWNCEARERYVRLGAR